jgi:hypothetical protein
MQVQIVNKVCCAIQGTCKLSEYLQKPCFFTKTEHQYMTSLPSETGMFFFFSSINLLAPEFGIYILAHPVCKMRIIQGPKKGSIMK